MQVSHVGVTQSNVSSNTQVLLQIVRVPIREEKGVSDAIVLFDNGADRTYVTESLVDRIGPEWVGTRNISSAAFGCNSPGEATFRNVYDFCLQGVDHSLHVQAAEVPSICATLKRLSVPDSVLSSLGEGLQFVEAVEGEVKVDILVGQDFYWRLMTPKIVSIAPGLAAQRTIFGWVMSGLLPEDHSSPRVQSNVSVSHHLLCCDVSESMVSKYWDLKSTGIVGCESVGGSSDEGFLWEGSVCGWSIFCGLAMERWVSKT